MGLGAAAAVFLLPLTLAPGGFPFQPGAEYSDSLTAHLSSALFLHRSVADFRQVPLWNPTYLSGMPFAADPLSGLWYPPLWLLAAFPRAAVLNLIFWAHLVLGGWGMWRLLRAEGLGGLASTAGALVFVGMPKLIGHVGLGHLSLVSAVSWTPWLFYLAAETVRRRGRARTRAAILGGLVLGVSAVADPRWGLPLGFAGVTFAIGRRLGDSGSGGGGWLRAAAGFGAASLAVVAGLMVPLAELTGLSVRAGLGAQTASALALPPERLLGWLVAARGGWGEWTVTLGSVAIVLALSGVAGRPRRGSEWAALVVISTLLALGDSTPVGRLAAAIPGLSLLRVPARWLFLAGFGAAVLAAWGIEAVKVPISVRAGVRARLAGVFVAVLSLVMAVAVAIAGGEADLSMMAFPVLALVAVLAAARTPWRHGATVSLVVLLFLELAWLDVALVGSRSESRLQAQAQRALSWATNLEIGTRVFSPSYSVPQEAAAAAGAELADGVHPLALRRYVDYMAAAVGFDGSDYSVTLPPFPTGDPGVDWGATLDAEALGVIGVGRVVSAYPLPFAGLELRGSDGGLWVYDNPFARPAAWVEAPGSDPTWSAAAVIERTPNRIVLEASGPGTLVLAEVAYPGWQVIVDGRRGEVLTQYGLLRAVSLEAGDHRVELRFVPQSLLAGLTIALAAAAVTTALWRRRG